MDKISIIGGDLRIVKLASLLQKDGYTVSTYGLEKSNEILKSIKANTLMECLENTRIVISSIPFSKDGKYVNTQFSDEKIEILKMFEMIKSNKQITTFIAGAISQNLYIENINIIDILEDESLTIMNAIPSAEGAIQVAMEESLKTIHGSNTLIMGFGRIGKILAKMINGLGAEVYCEARKDIDIAWIQAYGYNAVRLENLEKYLPQMDFIFNTIPFTVIDKSQLELIKKDCLIVDLASKPGGINFEIAEHLGIKTIWSLGLPGIVAPETAAKYIETAILKII